MLSYREIQGIASNGLFMVIKAEMKFRSSFSNVILFIKLSATRQTTFEQ